MSTSPSGLDFTQLQYWLQAAIGAPDLPGNPAQTRLHVQASEQLGADARLGIYQVSYRVRLLQSFHAIFPGLLQAMGHELLDAFAVDYLRAHKPRHYSINRIADGFLEHLRVSRPARESATPPDWSDFLLDLAALELALLEVSEAPGLERIAGDECRYWRELPDADLLRSQPCVAACVRLLHCNSAAHEYLNALRLRGSPAMPPTRHVWLALSRSHYRLVTREVARVQWEMLRRMDGCTCLARVLEELGELELRPAPGIGLVRLWLDNFSAQGLLQPGALPAARVADFGNRVAEAL